jgi:hypothetical protein
VNPSCRPSIRSRWRATPVDQVEDLPLVAAQFAKRQCSHAVTDESQRAEISARCEKTSTNPDVLSTASIPVVVDLERWCPNLRL